MELAFVARVRSQSNSLVVTIPAHTSQALKLKTGDYAGLTIKIEQPVRWLRFKQTKEVRSKKKVIGKCKRKAKSHS